MKKQLLKTFRTISAGAFALVVFSTPVRAQWNLLGGGPLNSADLTTSTTAYATFYAPLAISGNTIYVAYPDPGASSKMSVKNYNGATSSWDYFPSTTSSGISTAAGGYSSIAINQTTGNPVLSYRSNSQISILNYDGTAWGNVGDTESIQPTAPASAGPNTNVAADGNIFYATYVNSASGGYNAPIVARYDGSAWTHTQLFTTSGTSNAQSYIRVAVGADHNAYVAYADQPQSNRLTVRKFNTTSNEWDLLGPAVTTNTASYISLVVDNNNIPYVAYRDNGGKPAVRKYNSIADTWDLLVASGSTATSVYGNNSTFTTLAFDPVNNLPYLAFVDGGISGKLTVLKFNGGTVTGAATGWQVVGGTAGFTPAAVTNIGLKVGSDNRPLVAVQMAYNTVDQTTTNDYLYVYQGPVGTLPVTVSSLDAKAISRGIEVKWTTSSESNSDKFVVEKSTDGVTFAKITEVKSKGPSRYSIIDADPENGENYYRLVQYDLNGASSVFGPVVSNFSLNSVSKTLSVYPNPSRGSISFKTDGLVGVVQIALFNILGNPVYTETVTNMHGSEYKLNLGQSLSSGQYMLHIANNGQKKTAKIIIQ